MDHDKLLNIAVEMGCQLMASGAEIYRVEESMERLLLAYDLPTAEVFAIPNCIIASVNTPEGHPITRMRRIASHGTELPPLEEAEALVMGLSQCPRRHAPWQVLVGHAIAAAFFAPLFGGGVLDTLGALLGGLGVGICLLYGKRLIGSNTFFRTVICSAIASLLSLFLVRIGLGRSLDTVTISVLMLLVPGVALTNAMREIMAGDVVSGLSRTADAILVAAAIALGSAVGLGIAQLF